MATLACVAPAVWIAVFSTSSISLALPDMQHEFHVGGSGLQWIVSSYVLVYASLVLAGGALSDRRGKRAVFLVGLASFGFGSLLGALAASTAILFCGRVIQGLGAAMILPVAWSFIAVAFADPRERGAAIGALASSGGLAMAMGPPLGGLLVDAFGWRSVFSVNVPISCILLAVGAWWLPRGPGIASRTPFDGVGVLLSAVLLSGLCAALIEGPSLGWASPTTVALACAAVVAGAALVLWELRHPGPLVDVRLLRNPALALANVGAAVTFFGVIATPIFLSLYFIQVGGLSPVATGLKLIPIGLSLAVASITAGYLLRHVDARWLMALGLTVSSVGLLLLLGLGIDAPDEPVIPGLVLLGLGGGLALPPMNHVALGAVDPERLGMAAALHNGLRQVGLLLGVAVLGTILYASLQASLSERLAERGVPAPVQAAVIAGAEAQREPVRIAAMSPAEVRTAADESFVWGMHRALLAATVALLAMAAACVASPLGRRLRARYLTFDQMR